MAIDTDTRKMQLRRAARLTRSKWAAWLEPLGGKWRIAVEWGLGTRRRAALENVLAIPQWQAWLRAVMNQGRSRKRALPSAQKAKLASPVHAFPAKREGVLLVGGEMATATAREIWRIVAVGMARNTKEEAQTLCRLFSQNLQQVQHQPEEVAGAIVAALQAVTAARRIYVATLAGHAWQVLAARGNAATNLLGREIHAKDIPLLKTLNNGQMLVLSEEPWPGIASPKGWSWLVLPLEYGQQMVGFLSLARPQKWEQGQQNALLAFASRIAWIVESALAFDEISTHLRRKAVLSDLLLSGMASEEVELAATNAARYLQGVFQAHAAAVFLRTVDNQVQCVGAYPPGVKKRLHPIQNSACQHILTHEEPVRFSRTAPLPCTIDPKASTGLCVPLRARHGVMGALCIASRRSRAFTKEDEHLLALSGGQLALMLETIRLREETAARARRMEMVHRIIRDVVGITDIQKVVDTAAKRITEYFGPTVSAVAIIDQHLHHTLFRGIAGQGAEILREEDPQCPPDGVVNEVLRQGKSILIHDVTTTPHYRPYPNFSTGSELCVPIFDHEHSQKVIGIINVEHADTFAFAEEDRLAMEAVAGVLSAVLANARRHQRLNTTIQHLKAARETAMDIATAVEMQPLLQRVVQRVKKMVDTRGVEIGLLDEEKGIVHIVASESPWGGYAGMEIPLGEGAGGWASAHGQTLVLDNFNAWEHKGNLAFPAAFHAVVSVPLKFHAKVLGVLTIFDDREGHAFSHHDVQLLELLAPQVAVAIRNARLYEELHQRIQAQQRAERELVQSARLAAVGEMAAAIAHELNSPLTTVMGFVELALEELRPEEQIYTDLQLVLQEARRAHHIIQRLLDFARHTEPIRLATDINTLVHETLMLVKHLLATSNVTLDVQTQENLPMIMVDRAEIKQVLLNLIHNAIQAMPHGGQLHIATATHADEAGQWVTVTVSDTGIGMSPAQKMRIFEPFYTTRGNGTGLGLSVSYSIIQKHAGTISVESQEGHGSTFTVHIPAA